MNRYRFLPSQMAQKCFWTWSFPSRWIHYSPCSGWRRVRSGRGLWIWERLKTGLPTSGKTSRMEKLFESADVFRYTLYPVVMSYRGMVISTSITPIDLIYEKVLTCNVKHIQLPMGAKDVPQVDNHVLLLSENSRRIVVDAKTYIREVRTLCPYC